MSNVTPSIIREVEGTIVAQNKLTSLKSLKTNRMENISQGKIIAVLVSNQRMTEDAKKAWWMAQTPILYIQLLEKDVLDEPIANISPITLSLKEHEKNYISLLLVNHSLRNLIPKDALLALDFINIRSRPN